MLSVIEVNFLVWIFVCVDIVLSGDIVDQMGCSDRIGIVVDEVCDVFCWKFMNVGQEFVEGGFI